MKIGGRWRHSPLDLTLSRDDVHVWRVALSQPAGCVHSLFETLSPDETARADHFYFERDRQRFVVGRGVLRAILGRYLGIEPGQLRFQYGRYGKPYLTTGYGGKSLQFNMSHSQDVALCAVAWHREVGIDIEHIQPIPDATQMARQLFSARENIAFQAIPERLKLEAFFTCWTRKEAYIKARGNGLSLPLDQFDVTLAPGETPQLPGRDGLPDELSLLDVMPGEGYVGALAIQGHDWHITCWDWLQNTSSTSGAGEQAFRLG